ncbi:MAG: hypothetical protein L0027_01525 [Candidatus Rokubacteria bacterium]|nr:hypothetical protein [Candidatus Rokubacteria bacterium]
MKPVYLADAADESVYGGKAIQLGVALRAGLPVPAGLALPAGLVDAIAGGDASAIGDLRRLRAELAGPVAVRSSAVGEDSAAASFAGQHLTCLNVVSEAALLEAVRRVWESGRSESALAYRKRMGIAGEPRVAVIVQRMVYPDCSGVLFTRDPISGRDERLVEASWGLGEVIVAGLVTPDRYRMDREGRILERLAGVKDVALLPRPGGEVEQVVVEEPRVHALCLDDARLARLHELATRCEREFGGTQDLEWAWAGNALHLLQRRAITATAGETPGR